jgi:fumarate hydratase subunit beta
MANVRRVRFPLSPDEARSLKVGDLVIADGEAVITAGLPTHRRIVEFLEQGKPLPLNLSGQAFLHVGMYAEQAGGRTNPIYANPTTSTRFSAQMPTMIRKLGLTAIAGKGGLDQSTVEAMREIGCVYLSMVGGASSMISAAVTEVIETAWDDLITQFRLSRIRLEGLGPLTVGIDAHGDSLYSQIAETARQKLPEILATMAARRAAL